MTYRPFPDADRALRQLHRHPQPKPAVRLAHWTSEPPGMADHRERFQRTMTESAATWRRIYVELCQNFVVEVKRTTPAVFVAVNAARKMRNSA